MAQARVTRGDQVVEVTGISSAAAYEIARTFALKDPPVAARGAGGDQELAEDRVPFGFAPIEGFASNVGVSR